MKKKKYLSLSLTILIIFTAVGLLLNAEYVKLIDIKGKNFVAELALTSQKRKKGLSQKKNLCSQCAMLFKFNQKKNWSFWMKGMQFNLDILWISDGKIVYMAKNVSYKSKKIITPPIKVKANEVLEINAGLSDKYDFKIGDRVKTYLFF